MVQMKLDTGGQCNVLSKYITDNIRAKLNHQEQQTDKFYWRKNISNRRHEVTIPGDKFRQRYSVQGNILTSLTNEKVFPIVGRKTWQDLSLVDKFE